MLKAGRSLLGSSELTLTGGNWSTVVVLKKENQEEANCIRWFRSQQLAGLPTNIDSLEKKKKPVPELE